MILFGESAVRKAAAQFMARAQAIREHLRGSGSMIEPFPEKAKGMHKRTYRVLLGECERWARAYVHVMAPLAGVRPDD